MSIRFVPAPARVQPYFDDGIVPLTSKTVDHEDYRPLPWLTPPISVYVPYQDEPFKLPTFVGDEDLAFTWPIPQQPLAKFTQYDDEVLANATNFASDDSLGMQTIINADLPRFSPFYDDEAFVASVGFTPLFRKTLSGIGGRIGQRQLQGF